MKLYNSVKQTLKSRISAAAIVKNNDYQLFNKIRNDISDKRKDFCLFLADDSSFISEYDATLKETSPKIYYCRPYLAASAYLGIPVINSIYEKDGVFYRGDDRVYGQYKDFAGYSTPPAVCGEKITESNMKEVAKAINRSHIIVLHDNNYSILDLE